MQPKLWNQLVEGSSEKQARKRPDIRIKRGKKRKIEIERKRQRDREKDREIERKIER